MSDLARRIEQFERLGGVSLSSLPVQEVQAGVAEHKRTVFQFRCPLCGNVARNNQDMEPMCTGPNWTDDHPPEVMMRI